MSVNTDKIYSLCLNYLCGGIKGFKGLNGVKGFNAAALKHLGVQPL